MCIRDRVRPIRVGRVARPAVVGEAEHVHVDQRVDAVGVEAVSYTHLRAHETVLDLVCRLLLEKKKTPRLNTTVDYLTTIMTLRGTIQ